jgi:3-oxoadipate enol-lactonase
MQAITISGRTAHAALAGDPDRLPLVFVNSLGTDLRIWDRVLPLLPPGLRLLRYDLRGHGLSDAGTPGWSVDDLADDLAALLDATSTEPAVICGLSVGGMIAQSLAARRPDQVRALVLVGTAARIGPPEMWDERITRVRAGGLAPLADGILARWFSARFRAEAPDIALWRNMLVRTPAGAYADTCAAIRDADLTASTAGLRLPVLALVGERTGRRRPSWCGGRRTSSPAPISPLSPAPATSPASTRPKRSRAILRFS